MFASGLPGSAPTSCGCAVCSLMLGASPAVMVKKLCLHLSSSGDRIVEFTHFMYGKSETSFLWSNCSEKGDEGPNSAFQKYGTIIVWKVVLGFERQKALSSHCVSLRGTTDLHTDGKAFSNGKSQGLIHFSFLSKNCFVFELTFYQLRSSVCCKSRGSHLRFIPGMNMIPLFYYQEY